MKRVLKNSPEIRQAVVSVISEINSRIWQEKYLLLFYLVLSVIFYEKNATLVPTEVLCSIFYIFHQSFHIPVAYFYFRFQ